MLCAQHRPGTAPPTVVWMIQQLTAAVLEQERGHMLLLTSIY